MKIFDWNNKEITETEVNEQKHPVSYEYDTAAEALIDMVIDEKRNTKRFGWETNSLIDKVIEPVIYNGVKLDLYLKWNKHIFVCFMGLYQYIGETSN